MGRPKKLDGSMAHVQRLMLETELSDKEVKEAGEKLARHLILRDNVLAEKKEVVQEFDAKVKEHAREISKLTTAVDTHIITEEVECEVYLDRENSTKIAIRKDNGKKHFLQMTEDDFSLLT